MNSHPPVKISLTQWDQRYAELRAAGLCEPSYGGPLRRHVTERGDHRLLKLRFDNSAASLRLWNFLLTEEQRLRAAAARGCRIIATMKDLGTVPVMVYSMPNAVAFYPDGAWWVPCIMENTTRDLAIADARGIDESFCPVRAMLGAFETLEHFPKPDLLICSAGATCDDFSAIAQRLSASGWPIEWWEIPARRTPDEDEETVDLPGGLFAPRAQVDQTMRELQRVRQSLAAVSGQELTDAMLEEGIAAATRVRAMLRELRDAVFSAAASPLPALETLIAEMLAIHYCSDRDQTMQVLGELLAEARRRVAAGQAVLDSDAARVFWVNPVADLRAMNLLEDCGGRVCGSEFMFCHALDEIPQDVPPMEALARTALADPMVGPSGDRAARICRDARRWRAEAVVISRIPGASHCAWEGHIIADLIRAELALPVVEIEVPPLSDAMSQTLRTRLEALVETVKQHRRTR